MPKGKIAFVVGHAHWGKSETLRALTNDDFYVRRMIINHELFFIRRMSNDDQPSGYVKFMESAWPANTPNLIAALCPNFHDTEAATDSILTTLRAKGYELFFWVIEHQYGKPGVVTADEVKRLGKYGKVEVFSNKVAAAARAKNFKQFVSNVVLAYPSLKRTDSSEQRRRTLDSKFYNLPGNESPVIIKQAHALLTLPAAADGLSRLSKGVKAYPLSATDNPLAGLLKDPRNVPVWFGTNRVPVNQQDYSQGFSGEWSKTTTHGRCIVNVPKGHVPGETGSPWWIRLVKGDDRLTVISIEPLPNFWNQISEAMKNPREEQETNEALFFLHGYNVTFEEAAIRTAQLAYDLRIQPAVFFSWPSRGNVEDYPPDEAAIEASYDAVSNFVKQLDNCALDAGTTLHVVAHSMGNRALLKALEAVAQGMAGGSKSAIDKLVFAAPDVDARVFMQSLGKIVPVGKRKTLYTSHRDRAVWLSKTIHKYDRAGLIPPVTIAQGLDTIDATDVDKTFIGHDYVATVRALINDLSLLFKAGLPPIKRGGIERAETPDGQIYWQIL